MLCALTSTGGALRDAVTATWHTQLFSGLAGGEWCFAGWFRARVALAVILLMLVLPMVAAVLTAQDYPLRYVRECLSRSNSPSIALLLMLVV